MQFILLFKSVTSVQFNAASLCCVGNTERKNFDSENLSKMNIGTRTRSFRPSKRFDLLEGQWEQKRLRDHQSRIGRAEPRIDSTTPASVTYQHIRVIEFLKMGHPGLFFVYFRLFKQTLQFSQQINVKNVHPVNGAGIRTRNLRNMSLLPLPLDQGSPGILINFVNLLIFEHYC